MKYKILKIFKISFGIYGLLLLLVIFTPYYTLRPGNSVPLYNAEYVMLLKSLCKFYNLNGNVPNDDQWMTIENRENIKTSNGQIIWNSSKKELRYEYDKEYPLNIELVHILSFGIVSSGKMMTNVIQNESSIIENSKLYEQ